MNSSPEVLRGSNPREQTAKRGGRRRGHSGTRAAVLAAAQRQFSELGYDRTTMRSVAAEARVDQKLVAYLFGSKQQLFVAATELPFDPRSVVAAVLAGDRDKIGERLAHFLLGALDHPDSGRRVVGLVRASAADPEAARMVRDLLSRLIWQPAAAQLPVEQPEVAVNLVATQLLGLVMARYIIRAEPLASLPPAEVAVLIAPILQRHLGGHEKYPSPPPLRRRARGAER